MDKIIERVYAGNMNVLDFSMYLTYSAEDERWQIVCTDVGRTDVPPHVPYPPHKEQHPADFKPVAVGRTLSEYQLIYITRGRGSFEVNDRQYAVYPGTVMVVLPGVRHSYRPDFETGWTEYWVGFRGPYADILREERFLSASKPVYEVGLQNSLLSIFYQIFELVVKQEPLYQLKTCAHVLSLIAEILSFERKRVQYNHSEQLVEKAKILMAERIGSAIDLGEIAKRLGVSTSHLNDVFRAYTGQTPYQYYIGIKIRKAKELLARDGRSVKEVGYELGFEDQYYFSRLFKKKTGVPPSRWSERLYE